MSGKMGTALVYMTIVGAVLSSPAHAACWEGQAVNAAKVRDLQSMMMVGALRCRGTSHNLLPGYNRFIAANKSVLASGNERLKAHFAPAGGTVAYDRFTTLLANEYGAGLNGVSNCEQLSEIADEATKANGNQAKLVEIADALNVNPVSHRDYCPVTIASK